MRYKSVAHPSGQARQLLDFVQISRGHPHRHHGAVSAHAAHAAEAKAASAIAGTLKRHLAQLQATGIHRLVKRKRDGLCCQVHAEVHQHRRRTVPLVLTAAACRRAVARHNRIATHISHRQHAETHKCSRL